MNVQELASDIAREGEAELERIHAQTEELMRRYREQTEELVRQKREQLAEQARRQEEEERRRQEAAREREAALAVLACKQQQLDEAFAAAAQELEKPAVRRKLLDRLLARAKEQAKVESIMAAKKDAAYLRRKAKVAGTFEGLGGFTAKSKDIVIDMRFETLLETVRAAQAAQIAKTLFEVRR